MVLPHATEDLVRDLSTKCSDGFFFGVAASPSTLDVFMSASTEAHLGDRDAVQRGVQLTIATTVETVTFWAPRPDRNGCSPVVHGKPSRRLETSDACSLANQLGSAERGAAV
jgi:hypothetical protein